jgi:hypothetical protein
MMLDILSLYSREYGLDAVNDERLRKKSASFLVGVPYNFSQEPDLGHSPRYLLLSIGK